MRPGVLLTCSVMLVAQSAHASTALQPPASDPIVVTGTRATPEEAQRQASEFVRTIGFGAGDRPVARWEDPVCLSIQGLRERYSSIIEREMRLVARTAGIRLAGAGCEANVIVAFTNDSPAFLRAMERRAPHYLAEIDPENRERLYSGEQPIRWLYSTRTQGADGRALTTGMALGPGMAVGAFGGGDSPVPPNMPMHVGYGPSSVSTGTARVLNGAAVIVDLGRLDGQSLGAIAAYVAMVAFAEIRSGERSPAGSILGLFEPDGNRAGLTAWDRTFLTTLYDIPLDRGGRRHCAIMMRELVAAMTGATTAEP